MRKNKKIILIAFCIILMHMVVPGKLEAATFDDINQSGIFVKQQTNDTCTLASAVMMVRRAALATGNSNWAAITESAMRGTAWLEGSGLYLNFSYAGISVGYTTLPGGNANTNQLISLLSSHPEGIVLYDLNVPHAILLTDYTNGTFYCADPSGYYPSGRIPISSASITIYNADSYWYVKSPAVTLDTVNHGTLNVDGILDGRAVGNTDYYGNFHVYINGKRVTTTPVSDYWNQGLNAGDTYEIRDINPDHGKVYSGGTNLSGRIVANGTQTAVIRFDTLAQAPMDVNFTVNGKDTSKLTGIGTIQVYVDGELQKTLDATSYVDFCQHVFVGKPYEVKVNITNPDYRFIGVDTSEPGYSGQTGTTGQNNTFVRLVFCKMAPMDVNFTVDGVDTTLAGIGNIQVYVDGELQKTLDATNYVDFYQHVFVGKPYEVRLSLTNSNYRYVGTDTSESGYTGQTGITGINGTKVRLVIETLKNSQRGSQTGAENTYLGNLTSLENAVKKLSENADPAGSTFNILQVKGKKVKKKSIKIGWKAVPKATGYVVYGAPCGSKYARLKDIKATSFTQTGLKKGKYYKYFVAAHDKNGKILATSKTVHIATSGGKKGNTKSVKLNKKKATLKKGKTVKLKATLKNGKLKVSKHRKVAFETDNPKVATVSKSGKIKAVGKGKCTIYAYAQNGVFAKCKITVK